MQFDPASGGPVPALSGKRILETVPGLEAWAQLECVDFALHPGPHMTPSEMVRLIAVLEPLLADPVVQGVVVTHGTDTLEESAYLVERALRPMKPVIFVGSMRNSSELGWDGPANLRSAVRACVEPACALLGTCVVLNDSIVHALDAQKTHTERVDTFQGRDFGPVGIVEKDRVIVSRSVPRREPLWGGRLEERVEIVTLAAGSDGRLIDAALGGGARGVVLQGLGRGNVPVTAIPAVERASQTGVPLVICSRCPQGRVLDTYAYAGSGKHLRRLGVLLSGWLPAPKARLELMLALGAGLDREGMRALFES